MASSAEEHDRTPAAMQAHLLGRIEFSVCLDLQRALLPEVAARDDGQVTLLLAEHPPLITVGRGGSPAEIARESTLIRSGQIRVEWVNRGGGCLVHCPGQLAVYLLVPLRWHSLTVGKFVERLHRGLAETLDDLRIPAQARAGRHGLWVRGGQVAAVGVAVRQWVTYYGAYVNVAPPMGLLRLVESDPVEGTRMTSLSAERRGPVRMPTVRATLVGRMAEAFGCDRFHLHTGHPLLRRR